MIIVLIFLLSVIVISIVLAVNRKFSPIPYFPTNSHDLSAIVDNLKLTSSDTLYDLGAGNGTLVFQALQKSEAKIVAVEVHPLLVTIMWVRKLFHPKKRNLHIIAHDLFSTNIEDATKIYLYVGPYVMKQIMDKILREKPPHLKRIVSYMYDFQLSKKQLARIKKHSVTTAERKMYILDL